MQAKKRNWTFLFFSNYVGILNDNFLKYCIIFIGINWVLPPYLTPSMLISLVSGALILPYLFFSPLGGRLAVLYSKQKIFRWCKFAEFPIMILAGIAFYYHSIILSLLAVLLMGTQSCLYSPAKYGLIRDIGGEKGLSFGNGIFETMAFLGILSGTVLASVLADYYYFSGTVILFLAFALVGYVSVRNISVRELEIEKTDSVNINPVVFLKESYLYARKYPYINCGILGVSVFWLVGGLIQMNLIIHCKETLQTNNILTGILTAIAAVGIALGCGFVGRLSAHFINTRMIFIGLAGMIVFLLGIVFLNPPVFICAIFIFMIAFMGGLFEVPCLALVQKADIGRKLGSVLAYMNLVIFIFILIGSIIFSITTYFSAENSLVVFAVIAGICLAAFIYFIIRYPQFLKNDLS
ncbi:MAG: MFS transporter [Bacteroidales bacterium]|jgi:acyl-[acyl-carrier-protein]-phospholipid O-acyltransferase/long-chain-fatty-acid--[acyl-carrier-protein] ligase|nr:MFS transporter [Bacteroidales bacterium]